MFQFEKILFRFETFRFPISVIFLYDQYSEISNIIRRHPGSLYTSGVDSPCNIIFLHSLGDGRDDNILVISLSGKTSFAGGYTGTY